VIPKSNAPKTKIAGLELLAVDRVDQAVQLLRSL
jgi:DNA repair protein RadA/Sms